MFLLLYEEFVKRNFNVRHAERKCSAVPIDQVLEKEYNKVVKGKSGVIGFTKQKDTVAKCNSLKHKKAQFFKNHEFSESIVEMDLECVEDTKTFISDHPSVHKKKPISKILLLVIIPIGFIVLKQEKSVIKTLLQND